MSREGPRVVVVTGASAGVGRATVRAFAAQRWSVGLIARGRDGLEAAAREVRDAGGRALPIVCDVADSAGMDAACVRFEQELGPIDVWVNNAMTSVLFPRRGDDGGRIQARHRRHVPRRRPRHARRAPIDAKAAVERALARREQRRHRGLLAGAAIGGVALAAALFTKGRLW